MRETLRLLWPEALQMNPRPPLDDYEVETHLGGVPPWMLDKPRTLAAMGEEDRVGTGQVPNTLCVVRPRWNAEGLARGVRKGVEGETLPGALFWQRYYAGRHWSVDVAMRDGATLWALATEGFPLQGRLGQFAAWSTEQGMMNGSCTHAAAMSFVRMLGLDGFSGVLNIELIDDIIFGYCPIEVHLRPSIEFGRLYGAEAREAVLAAAAGAAPATAPWVTGGTMIVDGRDTGDAIDVGSLDEDSWRLRLRYYPQKTAA